MCATAHGYCTPQNHRPGALQPRAELCPPPAWLFEAWQSSRDPAPSPVGPRPWQSPGVWGTEVFDETLSAPFGSPFARGVANPRLCLEPEQWFWTWAATTLYGPDRFGIYRLR